jgi:phosphoribosylglycinamide formyltransferase-1
MSTQPLPIAVLISGSGTTLQNLIDCIGRAELDVSIELVVASRPGIAGVDRAKRAGLRVEVIQRTGFGNEVDYSKTVFDAIRRAGAELVCLAGWLNLLKLPEGFQGRVLNIHPALLPGFGGRGMYGKRVHQAVIDAGCRVSGCTVHLVTDEYDAGPIVVQRTCPVLDSDTPDSLAARVFEEEKLAYPEAIKLIASGGYRIEGKRVVRT